AAVRGGPLKTKCNTRGRWRWLGALALLGMRGAGATSAAAAAGAAPTLLGAQYTYILQHQDGLRSPYAGPLSLRADGDTQPTHTVGVYGGWAPVSWVQAYLDVEKFMGAGGGKATRRRG